MGGERKRARDSILGRRRERKQLEEEEVEEGRREQ